MINVRGAVIRVSSIKPLVIRLPFSCGKCGGRQEINMPEGRFCPPTKCETPQCRGKLFVPERSSAVTVDWQKIRSVREPMFSSSPILISFLSLGLYQAAGVTERGQC
jgi:DNA replicative helicase MCM subunit Mcm2 (Cdc46/Mcm family)